MEEGVQVLKDVDTHIKDIFLNAGLKRIGEADSIEENQEHQNKKGGIQRKKSTSNIRFVYKTNKLKERRKKDEEVFNFCFGIFPGYWSGL
jgi:hypothetical protein